MNQKKLYTTKDVAEALNVSPTYIRQLIIRKQVHPLEQLGRVWIFSQEELDRLLAWKSGKKPHKTSSGRPKKRN